MGDLNDLAKFGEWLVRQRELNEQKHARNLDYGDCPEFWSRDRAIEDAFLLLAQYQNEVVDND